MENGKSVFFKAATANFLIIVFPILAALVLAFVFGLARFADTKSPFFFIGIGLMVVGWCLLIRSKWDQIRRGELWTFGVSQANPRMRQLYRLSYGAMVAGYLISTFSGSF